MGIKLQFACLQKDGNMVKNTPFPRGDFSRIQTVNWIMAANELQRFSSSNSFSAHSPPAPGEGPLLLLDPGEAPVLLGQAEADSPGGHEAPLPQQHAGLSSAPSAAGWTTKKPSPRQAWQSRLFGLSDTQLARPISPISGNTLMLIKLNWFIPGLQRFNCNL